MQCDTKLTKRRSVYWLSTVQGAFLWLISLFNWHLFPIGARPSSWKKLLGTSLECIKGSLTLPGGELNPGLPRDRRGYWPLYYRGTTKVEVFSCPSIYLKYVMECPQSSQDDSLSLALSSLKAIWYRGRPSMRQSFWPWISLTISMCVVVTSAQSAV